MIKKLLLLYMLGMTLIFSNTTITYAADSAYKNDVEIITDTESDTKYKLKTLIVTSSKSLTETYNAIAAENCSNVVQILQYETEQDTKNAYYKLKADGYDVSIDQIVEIEHNNFDTGSYIDTLNVVNNLQLDKAQALTYNKEDFHIAIFDYPYDTTKYPNSRVITKKDSTKYLAFDRDNSGNIIYDDSGYPTYKEYTIDFSKGSNNHGTYVTSVLLDATSSNVKIHSYIAGIDHFYQTSTGEKSEQLNSTVAEFISELDRIIEDKCKVVNMSIQWVINSSSLENQVTAMLDKLHYNGIIIVAAAGNNNEEISKHSYPQCLDYVINVSSVNKNKKLSSFSNYGDIDFCAPGEGIPTISGAYVSGTSFSSPYIAAFISEILQINKYTDPVNEIEKSLASYCEDLGITGKDSSFGHGYPIFTTEIDFCKDGHTYESTIIDPTCTEDGYTKNICKFCGNTNITDKKTALDHTYEFYSKVEPSCTTYGYSIYRCTGCKTKTNKDIVQKLNHHEILEHVDSTCKEKGYDKTYCDLCDSVLIITTLPINTNNHTYKESTIEATCQNGKQIWNTCIDCNYKILVKTVSNKVEHNYKNNVCEYCGATEIITKPELTTSSTTESKESSSTETKVETPTTEEKKPGTETTKTDTTTTKQSTKKFVKVKKISKKKIKLSWSKIKNAKSYQIQISTSKKFTKKTTKTYNTKKLNYTIKNLKKKTYYIRVRAKYKNKKYSSWKTVTKYKLK